MRIVHRCNGVVPPTGYGGTERIVFWLAREQARAGHRVTVVANAESPIADLVPGVNLIPDSGGGDLRAALTRAGEVVHFHHVPDRDSLPETPFLVTEHGNRKDFPSYPRNTVFVSRSHAGNHGSSHFVYNGIPKQEYPLEAEKKRFMLFMALLRWRVKNAETAIALSLDTGVPLTLSGGRLRDIPRLWGARMAKDMIRRRLLSSAGEVSGSNKLRLLQTASVLFYAVNWHEPFGIAPHEALACGTPVLASPNGALTEFVQHGHNGFVVKDYAEALEAVGALVSMSDREMSDMAETCRESAYSIERCAAGYEKIYRQVMDGDIPDSREDGAPLRFSDPPAVIITARLGDGRRYRARRRRTS